MQGNRHLGPVIVILFIFAAVQAAAAQSYGTLRGTVALEMSGQSLHHASVLVPSLGRTAETGDDGTYVFEKVPAGAYDVVAHMHPLTDLRKKVQIAAGETVVLDFQLRLEPVREEVTVTASGREQTTLEAFQSVTAIEQLDLATQAAASLGEVLDKETGVAKRSSGPGTSRPVVRGFDGDRVLILQDGMPTGTLSSQSGDHGEPVNATELERVEVVRGPATLLYGTNALGGVVNTITGHHQIHQHPHEGLRGFLTGTGGTNNATGGGSGGFEYGTGKWLISGTGGGLRTGDYKTPLGEVANSETAMKDAAGSLAHYTENGFFHAGYAVSDGRYGVPLPADDHGEEGPVDLKWRRQNVRFTGGIRNFGAFERFTATLNYSDWNHKEVVGEVVGTEFFNKQFVYRGVFDQHAHGRMSGSFGFSGLRRSYSVRGEEQLTPPATQDSFAGFALEEFSFDRFRLQFGGRLESNRFDPDGLRSRSFTGLSGSAAMNVAIWKNGALVASYNHSYRSPAMEELYNFGPHHGNFAFEIGDSSLKRELGDGFEVSYRHRASRVRGELNLFHYQLSDFVYLAPTGEIEEGLVKALYTQADSRYMGAEARLDLGLRRDLWLSLGFDSVDAQLRESKTPLPRIPPVRGRIGLDAHYKGFSFEPELALANAQNQLYFNEARTAGYAVINLKTSYTIARQHTLHVLSLNVFNAADQLYRNHLSLIKEFAPETGRGVRFAYTIRFF